MTENTQGRRAVVVGGAGYIGSNLTEALLEEGIAVDVIDDLSGGKREHVHPDAIFHEMDMRNYNDIAPVIDGATYVFHLAALPRVQYSIDYPEKTHDVNINGTFSVFRAAKEGGVKRVVYSASSSAYGDQPIMPLTEDMNPNPQSPYALHKFVGERYAKIFSEIYGLPTVSLRYFNVYGGKNMDPEGAYALVIGKFLKYKKEGKPLPITGDGEQSRDFTHIRDVIRANMLAATNENVGAGEVFNIGAGNNVTINQLAKLMGGEVEYVEERKEPKHTLAGNKLASEVLGWRPEIKIEEGIEELLADL